MIMITMQWRRGDDDVMMTIIIMQRQDVDEYKIMVMVMIIKL